MTGRKPRCVLSFSRSVLIIAAGWLYAMATAAAAAASCQLLGGIVAELARETEIGHVRLQGLDSGSYCGRHAAPSDVEGLAAKHRRLAACINSKYMLSCVFCRRPEQQPVAVKATTRSMYIPTILTIPTNSNDSYHTGAPFQGHSISSVLDDGAHILTSADSVDEISDIISTFTVVKMILFNCNKFETPLDSSFCTYRSAG